jgi:hypothetical protein
VTLIRPPASAPRAPRERPAGAKRPFLLVNRLARLAVVLGLLAVVGLGYLLQSC